MPKEYVVLFAGPMGAGKTTAISTLSETPVVRTEAVNTDRGRHEKASTTVALDYGEITLDQGDKVRLYGVPGQERFDFMWRILRERALGVVLLIDDASASAMADLDTYLTAFGDFFAQSRAVVGITRADVGAQRSADPYQSRLDERGLALPVFVADARDRTQMLTLLSALIVLFELNPPTKE
jgi:signal recognition particle receptor subunit beta